jgi:hypothetical protein
MVFTVIPDILVGYGLLCYFGFTAYSLYLVYTSVLEHNAPWITRFLYYTGLFNVALWTTSFSLMLILKLGRLI